MNLETSVFSAQISLPGSAMLPGSPTKTKACARDVYIQCGVMPRKEKMQTEKDLMWPEKIAAIYTQFPWLQGVYPQTEVDRTYVRRFDESTLNIRTDTFIGTPANSYGSMAFFKRQRRISAYLVDQVGASIAIGQKTVPRRYLLWRYIIGIEYFNETVRHAIQRLPQTSTATHVVLIKHGNQYADGDNKLTCLTVFKPPQNGITLWQWYTDQVTSIGRAVAEEIKNT